MNMKWIPRALLAVCVGATGMNSQTPAKPRQTAVSKSSLKSDQEKNIHAYIELLRSDTRKDKAQIVGAVMQLDAEDAAKFWPIYKEFESEYTGFGDGVLALIKNYAANYDNMTPAVADQIANRLLDLEQQRNALKRKYYQRFKTALDPITATRFLQVENQLERIVDLQIASELPVVEASQRSQP